MAQSVLQPAWGDANAANGKSMADNSKLRVPGEPYRRAAEPADDSSYGSDPLTELARLIGKNDPYAEFGRGGSRDDERQDAHARSGRARDDAQPSLAREHYDERYYDERPEPAAGERPEAYGSGRESYALNADLPLTPRVSDWRSDHAPRYDEEPHFGRDHESEPYGDDDALQARTEHHEDDGNSDLGAAADNQEEQSYDDPPRAYRHGGLATALALIGCAILGTAGAYAYRSYFGQPSVAQPPPVITADTATPAKIVPPTAGDAQSGKTIQDRVANASREQVVSKQEEPVALKDLGTQGAPRVVLPTPVTPTPGPAAAPSAPAAPSGASTEPRKVRTVPIRPDGSDPSGRSAMGPAPAPSGAPAAPRAATPAPKSSGGPLSLDPQPKDSSPPPATRTRTATAPVRSESSTGSSGGFLVQLSSQKTEAEAASSFRGLQAKFPNELGGRQVVIRRADLGTKGVFYRTMVGPFASAQEANQFCASYKAAGGHCVVPNN
jgi:hypothetical protein